jgi:hypothetical protein
MKSKKVISMVLASGILMGGAGISPIRTFAATNEDVQATSVKTQKDLDIEAYNILKELNLNPTEENIRAARKALASLTDGTYRSSYRYLLDVYTDRGTEKPAIDELIAANALNAEITSGETETNFGINLDGKNLSKEEEEQLAMMKLILTMNINSKMKFTGEENTKAKVSGNVNANLMGQEMKMNIWADVDISSSLPQIKYIIQVPEMLKALNPALSNKDYLVFDFAEVMENPAMQQAGAMPDMGKIMDAATKFSTKFTKSFDEFIKIADAKYGIVERKDIKNIDADGKKALVKAYKVNIDNDDLVGIIGDMLKDEDMMKAVKTYLDEVMALDPNAPKPSNEEFYAGLEQVLPVLNQLSNVMNFDITFDMGVNKEGYVSYQNGNIKMTINPAVIASMAGEGNLKLEEQINANSSYTVTINLDSNMTNINGDVKVEDMPKVTEENSVSYTDLMNMSSQEVVSETITD